MDWTHFVKPGLDSFVKHGLDSFVKHGLDSFVKHGLDSFVKHGLDSFVKHGLDSFVKHGLDSFVKHVLDSFVKHGLFQHILPNRICIMTLVIFQIRKDQNKSKFKEKIQHYQFDLTFYGICTFCFIFQLSI